jgi:hypothetical protein
MFRSTETIDRVGVLHVQQDRRYFKAYLVSGKTRLLVGLLPVWLDRFGGVRRSWMTSIHEAIRIMVLEAGHAVVGALDPNTGCLDGPIA